MTGRPRSGTEPVVASAALLHAWCGRVVYEDALRWQERLVAARAAGQVGDVVLSLEHDAVYTAGRHADVAAHVLGTTGIRVVPVARGGDVTYHGPGQLVVYPILRLPHAKAVRPYVTALEQACVRTAASFGITARTERGRTGVWVGDDKLVAVGIKVDGRVTSHGLAFNVRPRLEDYDGIVPCGIPDAGVCSLASLGVDATVDEVRDRLLPELARALGCELRPTALDTLLDAAPTG